jgi:hypothetical protein
MVTKVILRQDKGIKFNFALLCDNKIKIIVSPTHRIFPRSNSPS